MNYLLKVKRLAVQYTAMEINSTSIVYIGIPDLNNTRIYPIFTQNETKMVSVSLQLLFCCQKYTTEAYFTLLLTNVINTIYYLVQL